MVIPTATSEEIKVLHDAIKEIDPDWTPEMTTKKDIEKLPRLTRFIKTHCSQQHYKFECKKCGDPECEFKCKPVRMPSEVFKKHTAGRNLVLFPMLNSATQMFKPHDEYVLLCTIVYALSESFLTSQRLASAMTGLQRTLSTTATRTCRHTNRQRSRPRS